MTGIQLNHKLQWTDLLEHCTIYDDPGIQLPTGDCGLIHIIDKKTQLQVENRHYLSDKICQSSTCQVTGSKIFRKSQKSKIKIPEPFRLIPWDYNEMGTPLRHFIDCLAMAIREFAETERKKVVNRKIVELGEETHEHCKKIIERLKKENKWINEFDRSRWCHCQLFTILIENGDIETLLSYSNDEIRKVLQCMHGGQAVGNNIRFLWSYVLNVYIYTNLIVAFGLQEKPDEWGPMKPGSHFRESELMHDCDGQTFLYGSRKFLDKDVYLKDMEATREMCKNLFRFMYYVDMLWKEVQGDQWGMEDTRGLIIR